MMAKPAMTAAAAGLGRPRNDRWSSSSLVSTLNRASLKRRAGREGRRNDPHRLLVEEGELRTHLHQQETPAPRRSDTTSHRLSSCGPELARRPRQPGHVAVEAVEDHRQEDQPAAEHAVARINRHGRGKSSRQHRRHVALRRVGVGTREAMTIAKKPHTRLPSVNSVGRTAMVRMGRMGRDCVRDCGRMSHLRLAISIDVPRQFLLPSLSVQRGP